MEVESQIFVNFRRHFEASPFWPNQKFPNALITVVQFFFAPSWTAGSYRNDHSFSHFIASESGVDDFVETHSNFGFCIRINFCLN